MANPQHLRILHLGIDEWNEWRAENPGVRPDLAEADLMRMDLSGADLSGADLNDSSLISTDLARADLGGAQLDGANLGGASLIEVDLSGADLNGADLNGADLIGADLSEAELVGASLRGGYLGGAYLVAADLGAADLGAADLSEADLSNANLSRANLERAVLVRTQLLAANLSGASVYGAAAWDVETDEETQQTGLIITPRDEPAVMVDDLEVAQFIYLLLNREKLRNVIDAVTQKGVLILGRFGGGGIEVLHAIADQLRSEGYLPMIFDFERPRDRNYTETVRTLAGLARFAIVDLSGPSVPQELMATVDHFRIPFAPILEAGQTDWSIFADFLEKEWVFDPLPFESTKELLDALPEEVIGPAEARVEERQAQLDKWLGRD